MWEDRYVTRTGSRVCVIDRRVSPTTMLHCNALCAQSRVASWRENDYVMKKSQGFPFKAGSIELGLKKAFIAEKFIYVTFDILGFIWVIRQENVNQPIYSYNIISN